MHKMAGLPIFAFLTLCVLAYLNVCAAQNVETVLTQLKRKLAQQNRKIVNLNRDMTDIKSQLEKVDEVKGLLEDYPPCPNGVKGFYYKSNFKSCYKLEPNSVLINSTQAETLCQSYNPASHLVAIETKKEQDFLRAIWKNTYGISSIARFWTSGHRRNKNWVWGPNNRKIKYEHWIPTTDHSDDRFQCLGILSSEAYFWADVACWAPHVVTCEMPHP